jgi:3D (Asp-Asp-Asp) domain-containing protein
MRLLIALMVLIATTNTQAQAPQTCLMLVTAYCPCPICCGPKANGITASGHPVTDNDGHFVAAPKNYPFGTMVTVPGYNNGQPVPVYDRGGAIKGNHIDIFFKTHQEALNWGKQYLQIGIN